MTEDQLEDMLDKGEGAQLVGHVHIEGKEIKRLKSKKMQLCRFVLTFVRQFFFVMIFVGISALAEHCFV